MFNSTFNKNLPIFQLTLTMTQRWTPMYLFKRQRDVFNTTLNIDVLKNWIFWTIIWIFKYQHTTIIKTLLTLSIVKIILNYNFAFTSSKFKMYVEYFLRLYFLFIKLSYCVKILQLIKLINLNSLTIDANPI